MTLMRQWPKREAVLKNNLQNKQTQIQQKGNIVLMNKNLPAQQTWQQMCINS